MAIDGDRTVDYVADNLKLNNLAASVDPTVNDDANDGYSVGSCWVNTSSGNVFKCTDASVGAAVWGQLTGGGSLPTPTGWGANTETLSAAKTLTDGSDIIQFLNPNGGTYNVELPANSTNNPMFIIVNAGIGTLNIVSSAGAALGTIDTYQMARTVSDGNSWAVSTTDFTGNALIPAASFGYGANASTPSVLLRRGGYANSSSIATASYQDYTCAETAGFPCVCRTLAGHCDQTAQATWKIWKNGAESESAVMPSSDTEFILDIGTALTTGDRVAVEYDATADNDPDYTNAQLYVSVAEADHHSTIQFYTIVSGTGYYAGLQTDTNRNTFDPRTQAVLPACTVVAITWRDLNTNSGYYLWKNGATSEWFQPGVSDVPDGYTTSITTTFANADVASIEYDSGGAPGNGTYSLVIQPTGFTGTSLMWGGYILASNYVWTVQGAPDSASSSTSSASPLWRALVPFVPTGLKLGWHTNVLTDSSGINIYKNNALSETEDLSGSTEGFTDLSMSATTGDLLDIRPPTSNPTTGSYCNFYIWLEI